MAQQIINIGTEAGSGDGDDLRVAFNKVNQNFSEIYNGNVLAANIAVYSVAGRTGNVELSVIDILGAASTGDITNVKLAMAANSAADRAYIDSAISGLSTDFNNVSIAGGTLSSVQITGDSWATLSNLIVNGTTYTNSLEVTNNIQIGGNIGTVRWINFADGTKMSTATVSNLSAVNASIAAANLAITGLQSNATVQANQINALNANVTAANAAIATLSGFDLDQVEADIEALQATTALHTLNISSTRANVTLLQANTATTSAALVLLDGRLSAVESNVSGFSGQFASLTANAVTQAQAIDTLTANSAAQGTALNTLFANAAAQHSRMNGLDANAASQASALSALTANAATQSTEIVALQSNASTQAGQIASKADLSGATFTGNVTVQATLAVTGNASANFIQTTKVTANTLEGLLLSPNQVNITRLGTLVSLDVTGNITASNLTGTLLTGAQPNITSIGTLGTLSVTGNVSTGNISGTKGTFNIVQGTLQSSAQPNVTQLGTLVSLGVAGNVSAGNVSATKGTFTSVEGTLQTAAQPNVTSVGTLSTLTVSGAVSTGNLTAGNVSTGKVTASTVEGTLLTASQPNITSVGTLSALAVTGNIVLDGALILNNPSVTFSAPRLTANLLTANFATITQNITGATATFSGNVGVANLSTTKVTATTLELQGAMIGTSATLSETLGVAGNVSAGNVSATKGTFTSVEGTLLTASQPNITSVGVLDTLEVSGNVVVGNVTAVIGEFDFIGGFITDPSQPNITEVGTLANLNVAGNITVDTITANGKITANEFEGTLLTASQPNITEVGTLGELLVNGGLSAGGNVAVGENLYIAGNLYVAGNSTTVDSESVSTTELTLTLASGAPVASAADGAGIFVATANAAITYDATTDKWVVNKDVVLSGNIEGNFGQFESIGGLIEDAFQPNITQVGALEALEVTGNISANNIASLGQIQVGTKLVFASGEQTVHYDPTVINSSLDSTNANVEAANAAIGDLQTVTSTQANEIIDLRANITAANSAISTVEINLTANAGSLATEINNLLANAAFQGNAIEHLETIVSLQESIHNDLDANTRAVSTEVDNLRANITASNSAISSLEGLTSTLTQEVEDLQANAEVQQGEIESKANIDSPIFTGVVTTTTLDVVGNLTVGNISGGNAIFENIIGNVTTIGGDFSGNVTAGNVIVTGQIEVDKIIAVGNISTSADISGDNAYFQNSIYGTIGSPAQPNIRALGSLYSLEIVGNINTVNSVFGTGIASFNQLQGTLLTASQPNITEVGTLDELDVAGNVSAGNVSAGTGVFTNVEGTLLTASQPNITEVGTLGELDVTGDISGDNLTLTGNVSALDITGTLLTASQPNITEVGTLVELDVTGNVVAGNLTAATGTLQINNIDATGNAIIGGTLVVTAIETNNITATGTGAVNLGEGSLTASDLFGNLQGTTASLSGTDASTSTSTGALIVTGGVGIGGNTHVGGLLDVGSSIAAGGDLTVDGEASIAGNVTMGVATGTNQIFGSINWHDTNFDATSPAIALFTTNVTTIEFGLTASDIEIGALLGTTTINHDLQVNGAIYGAFGNAASTTSIVNNVAVGNNTLTNTLNVTNLATLGNSTVTGTATFSNIPSISATTGAVQVQGGVGIAGNLNVGIEGTSNTRVIIYGTTNSTTGTTGALQVRGGVGIAGNIAVGGSANLASLTQSTSTTTGAVVVRGGVGIGRNLNVGGDAVFEGNTTFIGDVTIPTVILASLNDTPIGNAIPSSGQFTTLSTTARRPKGRPTVNLDFVNSGSLDTRVVFTRNSPATYVNRFGNIVIAANNQPRLTHNAFLQSVGLMIEEERTNLYSHSSEFDHGDWSALDATITSTPFVGPGPADDVYFIQEGSNLGAHGVAATTPPTVSGATAYTASVFAKAGTTTQISLIFSGEGDASVFDLIAGEVDFEGSTYRSSMQLFANGWYRCSSTVSKTNTNGNVVVALANGGTSNYIGNGTNGAYIYGFQLEEGPFPTSYIPTTTTGAVRLAEQAFIESADLNTFNNSTVGSWIVDATVGYSPTSLIPNNQRPVLISLDDGTTDNRIQVLAETKSAPSPARFANLVVYSSGVLQANIGDQSNMDTIESGKVSVYYRTNLYGLSLNGNSAVNDISGNISGAINRMQIGGGVGAAPLNGTVSKIMYWPLIITNSEAQELSRQ